MNGDRVIVFGGTLRVWVSAPEKGPRGWERDHLVQLEGDAPLSDAELRLSSRRLLLLRRLGGCRVRWTDNGNQPDVVVEAYDRPGRLDAAERGWVLHSEARAPALVRLTPYRLGRSEVLLVPVVRAADAELEQFVGTIRRFGGEIGAALHFALRGQVPLVAQPEAPPFMSMAGLGAFVEAVRTGRPVALLHGRGSWPLIAWLLAAPLLLCFLFFCLLYASTISSPTQRVEGKVGTGLEDGTSQLAALCRAVMAHPDLAEDLLGGRSCIDDPDVWFRPEAEYPILRLTEADARGDALDLRSGPTVIDVLSRRGELAPRWMPWLFCSTPIEPDLQVAALVDGERYTYLDTSRRECADLRDDPGSAVAFQVWTINFTTLRAFR